MDEPGMVSFPLPMLTALLCGLLAVLAWRLDLGITRARVAFSTLFALCTLQAFLVGLRFGYGMTEVIPLQRTLPLLLGPLIYLSFISMTIDTRAFARLIAIHIGASLCALALFWFFVRDLRHLDLIISISYFYYVIALFVLWRKGPDVLIYARVDAVDRLSNWMLRGVALLVFILVLDTAIALDFALNRGANAPALISYGTIPLIAVLFAMLMTVPTVMMRTRTVKAMEPAENDAHVEDRLRTLLQDEQLFLDHDLTVQRLARRLHLPARDVSGAINRTQGTNVSQYVNGFRLKHAADLLAKGDDSVTKIAEQSGFMTRSNFYREFQRVHGQSPTEFRTMRRVDKKPTN